MIIWAVGSGEWAVVATRVDSRAPQNDLQSSRGKISGFTMGRGRGKRKLTPLDRLRHLTGQAGDSCQLTEGIPL
jgi:hypothetical protein